MKTIIKVKQIENVCLVLVDKKRDTVNAMNDVLVEMTKKDTLLDDSDYMSLILQVGNIVASGLKFTSIAFRTIEQCTKFIETLSCVKKVSVKAFKLRDLQKKGE